MPKLSIIIPTLNEDKFLPKLLESIKRQTYADYEIIIADAGSKDRTCELAREAGARVVRGGLPAEGRNRGAESAEGMIFLFLDADVVLPGTKFLENALKEFEKRGLDIATCLIRALSKNAFDHIFYGIYNVYALALHKIQPHIPGFFIFVRRNIHEKIGGFDEELDFAEDHEYARRAAKIGKFGFLKAGFLPVSTRRFDRDGRLSIAAKYLLGELYLLTKGHVPRGAIPYGWGYGAKNKRKFFEELKKLGSELWQSRKYLLEKSARFKKKESSRS